jgi:hypothetical protein
LYTVPAGFRFILRHIHVSNPGAAVDFNLSIGADAAGTRLYDGRAIAADTAEDFYHYTTLAAAEDIRGWASVAAQLNVTLNGDLEAV